MTSLISRTDFGPVWGASGVQNFFGQGYPYHRYFRLIPGFGFEGMTFVAKTTTLEPRIGNMPLNGALMPVERRPRCIVVKLVEGVALNAVGLSGPGFHSLLREGQWQQRLRPFFLSFAPQGATIEAKMADAQKFANMLWCRLSEFKTQIGLQFNISCPNTGEDVASVGALVAEARALLDVLAAIGIPVLVKVNVLMPVRAVKKIEDHPACAGICVSNTIPWSALRSVGVDPVRLFGSEESPLAQFGGGGLSGAPLLPLVEKWVRDARKEGLTKHLNAGGGILRPHDVDRLKDAGADSVSLGSIAILRPWRLQATISRAQQLFR